MSESESESEIEYLKCHLCDSVLESEKKYKKHLKKDHGYILGPTLKCPFPKCSYFTKKPEELDHHLLTHPGMTFHKCTYCPRVFMVAGSFQRHLVLHTGKKPFVCCVCKKAFLAAESEAPAEKDFVCSMCSNRSVRLKPQNTPENSTLN